MTQKEDVCVVTCILSLLGLCFVGMSLFGLSIVWVITEWVSFVLVRQLGIVGFIFLIVFWVSYFALQKNEDKYT